MSVTTMSLTPRSGNLGVRLAAHLLRRTSFRFTKPRVDELKGITADVAVENLFNTPVPDPYIDKPLDFELHEQTGDGEWIDNDTVGNDNEGLRREWVAGWWFRNALYDPSATHKLAFFIHTLFTVSHVGLAAPEGSRYFYDHLLLLNYAAENGMNLKTLSKKMTLDNTMLYYLDNRKNRKNGVNENYARELLELFTIGRGEQESEGVYTNYTEKDITELAKVLTGFTVKDTRNGSNIDGDSDTDDNPDWNLYPTGIFKGYAELSYHDTTNKVFSPKFGGTGTTITGRNTEAGMYQELDDAINMIFAQPETARNYARKMYRFYVSTEIDADIETNIITPLATDLMGNGYNLKDTLKMLLKSEHFYNVCTNAEMGIGNIIKSPIELLAEVMSFFNIDLPDLPASPSSIQIQRHYHHFVSQYMFNMLGANGGLRLFGPPSVAGYPAYYQMPLRDKNWYNGSTIPTRYNIGKIFINNNLLIPNILHTTIDSVDFANYLADTLGVNVGGANAMVDAVVDYLLPKPLSDLRYDIIMDIFLLREIADTQEDAKMNWQCQWNLYRGIDSCNESADEDPERVRPHLDALIVAVLSAQEFQLK